MSANVAMATCRLICLLSAVMALSPGVTAQSTVSVQSTVSLQAAAEKQRPAAAQLSTPETPAVTPAHSKIINTDQTGLPTVLSVNVCADQLVLLLADPSQISALSTLSREVGGSYFHQAASLYPQAAPEAEDILQSAPDVVVTGPYTSTYTLAMLDELDFQVEILEIAESVAAMLDNIRRVGVMLKQEARAAAHVAVLLDRLARIDARVASLDQQRRTANTAQPRAAVYDPNGYTVGHQSLRGDALLRAGWYNVAEDLGIESYGTIALEDMIRLAPQALIESPYSQDSYSRGQMLASHPALREAGLDPIIITLPSNQTICAGPWLVDVIDELVDARERLLLAEKS